MNQKKVQDQLKRPLTDLRISVTDQCNFRCQYCMPSDVFNEAYPFLQNKELLSWDEIVAVAEQFAALGVRKIRLTGGEPLMRKDLPSLIKRLYQLPGIEDLALTTNGVLLPRYAEALKEAGMNRVTVSLDALDGTLFGKINGRGIGVEPVLQGMQAAHEAGLAVKVNMMVQKGINDHEILPMVRYFKTSPYILRLIEFMDVGMTNGWQRENVVTKAEMLAIIEQEFPLMPIAPHDPGEVASRFAFVDGENELGIISSISDTFCKDCSRARLSADGKLYTCLFASRGTDLVTPLRKGLQGEALRSFLQSIWEKRTDRYSDERQERTGTKKKIEMSYIGG
ncbi:molybdenum cofactor biosynthesis protein A [Fictibacillus macauensis ZFHKF-1]|uniref:GTP 3',8-cyclase n=1 Tax=Fictibacillus macauensis ZFHKF-1 TaxID=1196324 RepID=I8AFW2_9BACL|nr:GTP 3',8-cyclase MoaA [Fictibacillus macauensis]EIT84502.1 molybdenum cofactor biosynthesis protein A [Fictibacillus macauensis ZFHKF-1]